MEGLLFQELDDDIVILIFSTRLTDLEVLRTLHSIPCEDLRSVQSPV